MDDDSAAIRRAWKRDLDSALALVGIPKLADADVRLAWYADVLDPGEEATCTAIRHSADSVGFETFAADFLGSLAAALPKNESREARMLLGDMLYAVDASRRCAAQRRVGSFIETAASQQRPVIVVAYSLGSLVSYGYLNSREFANESGDVRFVTIGSPLGNVELRSLLGLGETAPRLPPGVSGWDNVYDPNDAFASPLDLRVDGVRDRVTIGEPRDDPHHISRYLRDRATGAAVGRALCAFRGDANGIGCPVVE